MRIVLAAATAMEIQPVIEWLKEGAYPQAEVLITGIGGIATTFALSRRIAAGRPDLIIQAGIGGSFSPAYPPGSLAFVKDEVFADLGALDNDRFTDVFDMGFNQDNTMPFTDRMLVNPLSSTFSSFGPGFVRGATVNNISATPAQVTLIREKYAPVIESMEGAALHYTCLMEKVSFIQLRAVSNFAGERDKARWKIREAVVNLNEQLKKIITAIYADHKKSRNDEN